jgi:hypothetical protein
MMLIYYRYLVLVPGRKKRAWRGGAVARSGFRGNQAMRGYAQCLAMSNAYID